METCSQKIKRELKRTGLVQEGLKYIEQNRIKTRFFDEYENKMSVYELASKYETLKGGQITGMVTISICDLFMKWLMIHGNDYLTKVGSKLKICDRCNENYEQTPEFDVCFEIDNEKCFFEIKFSQNDNSTQGATHGKNKVENFIIIQFKFDMYRIITENNTGILGDVWIGTTLKKPNFMGIATEKSSRTRFEYTYSEYNWIAGFVQSISNIYDIPIFNMKQ